MSFLKGDILFWSIEGATYPNTPAGRWQQTIDQVISKRENSPIVHCEVGWDHGYSIGSISGGVTLHTPMGYAYVASMSGQLSGIDAASAWILGMIGKPYGFGDILNQGLNLLPGAPSISMDKSYDCSDLVTRFLTYAGYSLPPTLSLSPQEATPAELYAVLQTLKA